MRIEKLDWPCSSILGKDSVTPPARIKDFPGLVGTEGLDKRHETATEFPDGADEVAFPGGVVF